MDTVTDDIPAAAISLEEMVTTSIVLFTNSVIRLVPFHLTTELSKKFDPNTISVRSDPPAVVELGLRLEIIGGTLELLTVNSWPFDSPPPGAGLNTVTVEIPVDAVSV